jgi:hypothetical protein
MLLERSAALRRSSSTQSPCETSGERGRRAPARRPTLLTRSGLALAGLLVALAACASGPPDNPDNACSIFADRRGWWKAVRASERRWGAPPELQLAILNQESSFDHNARPPRRKILFVVPGLRRQSSAYGFAQATRSTWDSYRKETGRRFADRDDFRDAADFVGWYANKSRRLSGIPLDDARDQYLAYHEGQGGYNRGSYRGNRELLRSANRVASRAATYRRQLDGCRRDLNRRFFIFF